MTPTSIPKQDMNKTCQPDDRVYTSNPLLQYRCKNCGKFWYCHQPTPDCHLPETPKECPHGCPWEHQKDHWHYKPPQPDKGELPERWEKEFEYKWESIWGLTDTETIDSKIRSYNYPLVRDFIRQLLLSRELPPAIGQVIEMVEGMKQITEQEDYEDESSRISYNSALDEVISKLKKK